MAGPDWLPGQMKPDVHFDEVGSTTDDDTLNTTFFLLQPMSRWQWKTKTVRWSTQTTFHHRSQFFQPILKIWPHNTMLFNHLKTYQYNIQVDYFYKPTGKHKGSNGISMINILMHFFLQSGLNVNRAHSHHTTLSCYQHKCHPFLTVKPIIFSGDRFLPYDVAFKCFVV